MRPELKEKIERRENTLNRVIELLISGLQLDRSYEELDPDTPLFGTGLGLDSVDAVEIVVALESEFGISLEEGDSMFALRTINSLVDVVLRQSEENLDDGS
ncbi:acyl carrier protein [Candidatus Poribacteria bacterium]|nr:acyl carrier protein [Candidatus Poribacteria bacterium]MYA99049.1 acyl carrier protein [Candidatus Poribacteria bacterium]